MRLKKQKKKVQVGIVLILILGLIFFQGDLLSIFTLVNKNPVAINVNLVSETPQYKTYKIGFSSDEGDPNCKTLFGNAGQNHVSQKIIIHKSGEIFTLKDFDYSYNYNTDDLKRNVDSELVSINLNDININSVSACGNFDVPDPIKTNQNAICYVDSFGDLQAKIEFDVDVASTDGILNPVRGSFSCKLLKIGIECLDNSMCSENEECKFNLCEEVITSTPPIIEPPIEPPIIQPPTPPTPQKIDVYRLNECQLVNILSSERTEFDFDTLESCEENIIKDNILIPILGLIILIIVLITIFVKTRRK